MEAQACRPQLLERPLRSEEAYRALTAINVVVVRTPGTSEECYARCLGYLRTHMASLTVQDLRATQPSHEPGAHERYLLCIRQSETLTIAAEIEASYVSPQNVVDNILFPDVSSTAYVIGTSSKSDIVTEGALLNLCYVEEDHTQLLDAKLFYQGSVTACIIIHDTEVDNNQSLKDVFYAQVNRLYDRFGTSVVHMLCRSSRGLDLFSPDYLCPLYPWLKYNKRLNRLRVDTTLDGYANSTLNYITARETVILYNTTANLDYLLRELVIHCVVCVLRVLVGHLENDRFAESQLITRFDDAELISGLSRRQRLSLCAARTLKIHGDILMMLNNLPQAVSTYELAKRRCKATDDLLFRSLAGFSLAISLSALLQWRDLRRRKASDQSLYRQRSSQQADGKVMCGRIVVQPSSLHGSRSIVFIPKQSVEAVLPATSKPAAAPGHLLRLKTSSNQSPSQQATESVPEALSQPTFEPDLEAPSQATPEPNAEPHRNPKRPPPQPFVSDAGILIQDDHTAGKATGAPHCRHSADEPSFAESSEGEQHFRKQRSSDDYTQPVNKDSEKLLRTYLQAFQRSLQMATPPIQEMQICLILMLHYLRDRGHYMRLYWVISRILEFADRRLSPREVVNFLGYIIDFVRGGPCRRKWSFYNYLYEKRSLENGFELPPDRVDDMARCFGLVTCLPDFSPFDSSLHLPTLSRTRRGSWIVTPKDTPRDVPNESQQSTERFEERVPPRGTVTTSVLGQVKQCMPMGNHPNGSLPSHRDVSCYPKSTDSHPESMTCLTNAGSGWQDVPDSRPVVNRTPTLNAATHSAPNSAEMAQPSTQCHQPCDAKAASVGHAPETRASIQSTISCGDVGLYDGSGRLPLHLDSVTHRIVDVLGQTSACSFRRHSLVSPDLRLTHFSTIRQACLDLAMKQCEANQLRLPNAHLALIGVITAAADVSLRSKHIIGGKGGDDALHLFQSGVASTDDQDAELQNELENANDDHTEAATCAAIFPSGPTTTMDETSNDIALLRQRINEFNAACRLIADNGRSFLFNFDHLTLASDVADILHPPRRGYRRLLLSSYATSVPINVMYSNRRLVYTVGGHRGSNLVVPVVTGIDFVPPRRENDDLIHVKPRAPATTSPRPRSSGVKTDYVFTLRNCVGYRTRCLCNFVRVACLRRMHSTLSTTGSNSHRSSGRDGYCQTAAYAEQPLGPRCRVVNSAGGKGSKCRLTKLDPAHATVMKSSLVPHILQPHEEQPTPQTPPTAIYIDADAVQALDVRITNPLPIELLIQDLSLLTVGARVEVIRRRVSLRPLSKDQSVRLHFVPRTVGRLEIVGVTFRLLGTVRCSQLFLRVPMKVVAETVASIAADPGSLRPRVSEFIRDGRALSLRVGHTVYRPAVSYHSTRLEPKDDTRGNYDHVTCSESHRLGRRSEEDGRMRRSNTRVSSIMSHSTCQATPDPYASRLGVRGQASNDASVPQKVKLCPRDMCSICCLTRQKAKDLIALKAPRLELIEGEERLLYVTVHNDSVDVVLSDMAVSVLPVLDEPRALGEVMTLGDREFATMKQRTDSAKRASESVRNFRILADKACIMRGALTPMELPSHPDSARSHCSFESSTASVRSALTEPAALLPGATLYVPVFYRAAITESRYHVRVDYEYESRDGPVRSTVYKRVDLAVAKGISIGIEGMSVQPRVDFDFRAVLKHLRPPMLQVATLKELACFRHVFDNDDVDVALRVSNATAQPFLCFGGYNSSFVALPQSEASWTIGARRLLYVEAKQMRPSGFVQVLDHYMALRWSLENSRGGELRLSDLSYRRPQRVPGTRVSHRVFSKGEYKRAVLCQYSKPVLWRMKASGRPLPLFRYSRVPAVVHANLHHLVEAKIALDLSLSVRSTTLDSPRSRLTEEFCAKVPAGVPFQLSVYARNNGDVPVDDYVAVIVPFLYSTHGRPRGLSWTGALEQVGSQSLVPVSRFRAHCSSLVHRRVTASSELQTASFEVYKRQAPVAHLTLVAHECFIYGIAAAIMAPAVAIAPVACAGPAVGAVVIAQVARLTGGQVECCVVCIDGRPASEGFKGVITRSNIHESKTIDSTVYEWFRPGDFVRARVISTSDSKQLMLSTAQRDLGVIRIPSAEEEMIPISWKFFLGTKTGTVVKRKVAHPSAAADGSSK
ncbi:3'-5' exoribonuclease [Babesia caballi]|uniref:3'-5' exoribonuclease n=1 Tax=Babesia caballi TaxID=5871 RepID=A0AAV4M321_BABCB|nr:3'-5' exoribonuclease [Babesia caballi]